MSHIGENTHREYEPLEHPLPMHAGNEPRSQLRCNSSLPNSGQWTRRAVWVWPPLESTLWPSNIVCKQHMCGHPSVRSFMLVAISARGHSAHRRSFMFVSTYMCGNLHTCGHPCLQSFLLVVRVHVCVCVSLCYTCWAHRAKRSSLAHPAAGCSPSLPCRVRRRIAASCGSATSRWSCRRQRSQPSWRRTWSGPTRCSCSTGPSRTPYLFFLLAASYTLQIRQSVVVVIYSRSHVS